MAQKTFSRYDFMTASTIQDPESQQFYPDPLSINYFDVTITRTPQPDCELNGNIISFFWRETENRYGGPIYDDVVLTLNKNPHKNLLKEGQKIHFPARTDLEAFLQLKKQ